MKETAKMDLKDMELDLDALENVTGGASETPMPMPTGGVTYKCAVCGTTISASTRDMTVTCPNLRCHCTYRVMNGKLSPVSSSL